MGRIENLGGSGHQAGSRNQLVKDLTADGRSVLVFTSYADTMEYLRDAVLSAASRSHPTPAKVAVSEPTANGKPSRRKKLLPPLPPGRSARSSARMPPAKA